MFQFAVDTRAEYRIRAHQGGIIFNLLSYMLLTETKISQRSVGNSLTDASFQALFPKSAGHKTVNHSGVSRRINTMPVELSPECCDYL